MVLTPYGGVRYMRYIVVKYGFHPPQSGGWSVIGWRQTTDHIRCSLENDKGLTDLDRPAFLCWGVFLSWVQRSLFHLTLFLPVEILNKEFVPVCSC